MSKPRVVVDTNIWVSYLFFAKTNIAEVGDYLVSGDCTVIASSASMEELRSVLSREKWDRYLPLDIRLEFYQGVYGLVEITTVVSAISECRDPKDNMLLETAHDGRAEFLLTGDRDLLELAREPPQSWKFRIVAPGSFLDLLQNQ